MAISPAAALGRVYANNVGLGPPTPLRPDQNWMSVDKEPALAARQMPMRSGGSAAKSAFIEATANNASRLCKSSRPNRWPSRAPARSASATMAAAAMKILFMTQDQCSVHPAETGVEFQHVFQRHAGAWCRHQTRRCAFGGG